MAGPAGRPVGKPPGPRTRVAIGAELGYGRPQGPTRAREELVLESSLPDMVTGVHRCAHEDAQGRYVGAADVDPHASETGPDWIE